ncbi:MAG: hypothetical protein K0R81_2605 [Microbacterium sp.]|nr:hypothetical protein [Microbacterium sp.]
MASEGFGRLFRRSRSEAETRAAPLSADLAADVDARREWVWASVSADTPLDRSDDRTALSVISALLADVRPDETWKLQSLGIVFGDVLARVTRAEWVQVDDERGTDAALRFGGPDDLAFPLTMISRRVEAGEEVDVLELFRAVATTIAQKQAR